MAPTDKEDAATGGEEVAGKEATNSGEEVAGVRRLHSAHSSGMESSVLKFQNINFTVGKGDKEKSILQDISAVVKWGRT